jgi:N-acetylmuramoyl-L-alanine amidase
MAKLCIYDRPIPPNSPGLESVIRVGDHSRQDDFHGVAVNWVARNCYEDTAVGQYALSSYKTSFIEALEWCSWEHIDVLNISKDLPFTPERDQALQKALDAGLLVIAAAGNNGDGGSVKWPASDPRVIAVGAINSKTGEVAGYSTRGKEIDVVAQGDWMIPALSGNLVGVHGTSFAAPVIAAYAAKWRAYYPRGTVEEFREFLRQNSKDLGIPGKDPASGWGLFVWPENWPPKEVEKKMPKVVVCPGHGGNDPGAIGPTGLKEKDVTLWVAQRLPLFLPKEIQISYTRQYDETVSLEKRVSLANASNASIFISVHCNAAENASAHGAETFCYKFGGGGERLAKLIQQEIVKLTGLTDRGVKEANFQVLRETKMPAALVELAFISNLAEETLLKKDSFRLNYCRAIANAIRQYFGFGEYLQPPPEAGGDTKVAKDYTGHWAEKTIDAVKTLGIMSGDPDGKFRPNDAVTRAELAQALFNLFNAVKRLYELS